jgi:hypothetical protein
MVWPSYEPDPIHVKLQKDTDQVWPDPRLKFTDWKEWVRGYLNQLDLLHHIKEDNDAEPPEPADGDGPAKAKMKQKRTSNQKKVSFWLVNQVKTSTESANIIREFQNKPKSMIEKLTIRWDPKSDTILNKLKSELQEFKMKPDEKIDVTNKRIGNLCSKLEEQGKTISDKKKRDILLRALLNKEWNDACKEMKKQILADDSITHITTYRFLKEEETAIREQRQNRTGTRPTMVQMTTKQEKAMLCQLNQKYGQPAPPAAANPQQL